jgi:hypothetical protein
MPAKIRPTIPEAPTNSLNIDVPDRSGGRVAVDVGSRPVDALGEFSQIVRGSLSLHAVLLGFPEWPPGSSPGGLHPAPRHGSVKDEKM